MQQSKLKYRKIKYQKIAKQFYSFFSSITKDKNILTEIIPLRHFNTIGFMKGKYNFRLFTAYTVQQIVIGFFEAAEHLCWKKKKKNWML